MRGTIEIGGEGGSISSPPGATATVDFFTNPPDGLATSLGAFPAGLGSSRDAVTAARTMFGVDGTGIQVGQRQLDREIRWDLTRLDLLIARTSLAGENVKLLDLSVLDFNGSNNYYLQLINSGGMNATYGIAIEVPEPGRDDAALIAAMHSLARRTHRGRTCGVLCLK